MMWSTIVLSTFLAFFAPASVVGSPYFANAIPHATIVGRQVQLLDSYDYVIVGGGGSGLTVADRLTENANGAHFHRVYFRIPNYIMMASDFRLLIIKCLTI